MNTLTHKIMLRALGRLDELLTQNIELITGGGGAMLLAHHYSIATADIDSIPKGIDTEDLDKLVKQIAEEQNIPKDWLNPYYATYAHTLPDDYGERLIEVFQGSHLIVKALGVEDLLIMKCFAHRQKDVPHAKALLQSKPNLEIVEGQIEKLKNKGIPGCDEALDFLDDVMDQL